MTKTGNSERTTIPAKERTAKDHAKAVGNGLLGVGEALLGVGIMAGTVALVVVSFGTALVGPGVGDLLQLDLLLQPTVLVESALLMVINHNKHNLFPKWMKKREGN